MCVCGVAGWLMGQLPKPPCLPGRSCSERPNTQTNKQTSRQICKQGVRKGREKGTYLGSLCVKVVQCLLTQLALYGSIQTLWRRGGEEGGGIKTNTVRHLATCLKLQEPSPTHPGALLLPPAAAPQSHSCCTVPRDRVPRFPSAESDLRLRRVLSGENRHTLREREHQQSCVPCPPEPAWDQRVPIRK